MKTALKFYSIDMILYGTLKEIIAHSGSCSHALVRKCIMQKPFVFLENENTNLPVLISYKQYNKLIKLLMTLLEIIISPVFFALTIIFQVQCCCCFDSIKNHDTLHIHPTVSFILHVSMNRDIVIQFLLFGPHYLNMP